MSKPLLAPLSGNLGIIKSKNAKAQENELLCKLIAYNITVLIREMFEFGINPDFNA